MFLTTEIAQISPGGLFELLSNLRKKHLGVTNKSVIPYFQAPKIKKIARESDLHNFLCRMEPPG